MELFCLKPTTPIRYSIFQEGEFEFYSLTEVLNNHTTYWVEHTPTNLQVDLHKALKFGKINKIQIPTEMYDFLHDYDENLE